MFKSVERYDPGSNSWALLADMNYGRFAHGAATHAGKIYVFGGYAEEVRKLFAISPILLRYFKGALKSVEVYDPDLDTWTLLDSCMPGVLSGEGAGAVTSLHKFNLQ